MSTSIGFLAVPLDGSNNPREVLVGEVVTAPSVKPGHSVRWFYMTEAATSPATTLFDPTGLSIAEVADRLALNQVYSLPGGSPSLVCPEESRGGYIFALSYDSASSIGEAVVYLPVTVSRYASGVAKGIEESTDYTPKGFTLEQAFFEFMADRTDHSVSALPVSEIQIAQTDRNEVNRWIEETSFLILCAFGSKMDSARTSWTMQRIAKDFANIDGVMQVFIDGEGVDRTGLDPKWEYALTVTVRHRVKDSWGLL